jgi:hypothetical protein
MSGEAEAGLCTGKKGSVWVTIRVHVILTFVAMTCLGGAAGQAAHKSPKSIPVRDHKALQQRENDLRDAANKLLQVFRTGDTATFLTLVHPFYFSAEESENIPIAKLREGFGRKGDLYCVFFDSSCLSPEETGSVASFSELAKRPETKILRVELTIGEGITDPGCKALVTFSWTDPVDNIHASGFGYVYEGGQWKVTGFDLAPARPPSSNTHRSDSL